MSVKKDTNFTLFILALAFSSFSKGVCCFFGVIVDIMFGVGFVWLWFGKVYYYMLPYLF